MADRIVVNTQTLTSISAQLALLQQEMAQLSSAVKKVHFDTANGGMLEIDRSVKLPGVGKTLSGKTVAEIAAACGSGLSLESEWAKALSRNLLESVAYFENTEHELSSMQPGEARTAVYSHDGNLIHVGGKAAEVLLGGNAPGIMEAGLRQAQQAMQNDMKPWQRDLAAAWLERIKAAIRPEDTLSAKNQESLNIAHYASSALWALINGQMDQLWKNSEAKQRYLFGKALDTLEGGQVQLLDSDLLPGDIKSDIKAILHFAETCDMDMKCLEMISEVTDTAESLIDVYNKMQIVAAMDQGQLESLASIYLEAGDPDVQAVGQELMNLAHADTAERIEIVRNGAIAGLLGDAVQSATKEAIESIGESNPYVKAITLTRDTVDALMNSSDIPQLQNEAGYSAEMVEAAYDVMQQRVAEYEKNPNTETFDQMMRSYEQYNLEIANSEQALADWASASDDSLVGQVISSEKRKAVIEKAESNAEFYKGVAQNTRDARNKYFAQQ